MKRIFFLFALTLLCSGAFAQFQQGRMLVGGNLGFQATTSKVKTGNTSTTYRKSTSFSLTPQFGYFVVNRFAVGAGLDLSASSSKPPSGNDKYTSSSVQLEPFVRYYLKPGIFFQGAFGIGSETDKSTNNGNTSTDKYGLVSGSLAAGYALFLNDNVALEPMIGFNSTASKLKDSNPSSKDIDSGLFIKVGFQIYLGK